MTRASNTAEAQLERILYILPAAARGRVPVDEIARALDVEPATVLRDLEDATARSYYHPAGSVESFSITTDGRTVQVHAPTEFTRPVRLSQGEAMALGLGLRALAADADVERRVAILNLAQRLEAALVAPDVVVREAAPRSYVTAPDASLAAEDEVEYEAMELSFDDDGFRGVVADAIELGRLCTIWYLKPGDVAPAYRSIAPYRLVYADGKWYVAAYDVDREALRFFRMDRVLNAVLEDEPAPALPPVELAAFIGNGGPYMAGDDVEVTVRYSPRVARWIAERTAAESAADGSVVVQHRVADPRWLVRHVLQYGGEAVIDGPDAAREWVAAAAADFEV